MTTMPAPADDNHTGWCVGLLCETPACGVYDVYDVSNVGDIGVGVCAYACVVCEMPGRELPAMR